MSHTTYRHLYNPRPTTFLYRGQDERVEELTIDRSKIYGVSTCAGQGKYRMTTQKGDEMYVFAYEDENRLVSTAREAWHQYRMKNDTCRRRVASQFVSVLYDGKQTGSSVNRIRQVLFFDEFPDDLDGSILFQQFVDR